MVASIGGFAQKTTTSEYKKPTDANRPPVEQGTRILAVIGFDGEQLNEAITVPNTVEAGSDFQISVITYGNGCVTAGDLGVVSTENRADVFVYDFTTADRPGVACTMIFKRLTHTATLRFTTPGAAVIRFWGRKQGGAEPFGQPLVIERSVMVK